LTTPDPVGLHRDLAKLAESGIEHVAIEASSHGLAQFRLDGVAVAAAAFTKPDPRSPRLPWRHGYLSRRKERLFTACWCPRGRQSSTPTAPTSRASRMCAGRVASGHRLWARDRAELRIVDRWRAVRQRITADLFGQRHMFELPLVGEFQAMNVLAALVS